MVSYEKHERPDAISVYLPDMTSRDASNTLTPLEACDLADLIEQTLYDIGLFKHDVAAVLKRCGNIADPYK